LEPAWPACCELSSSNSREVGFSIVSFDIISLYMGVEGSGSDASDAAEDPEAAEEAAEEAADFIEAIMFRKPLLRPGVKDWSKPLRVMNEPSISGVWRVFELGVSLGGGE
jgi:hypothetical protein